ncbi:MAG: protoheme IX farnesyltransferase [Thermodesulfobacteriota bacterium]|nr:protoheme IX farnesyltransferase [Thermodesulfobacteriota bacterium]
MKVLNHWLSLLIDLIKFRLSTFVTLSTATGFILAYQGISLRIFLMLAGVFLLASGASALNQYQERREDQRMERTKGRPIPSGKLSPSSALKISLFLIMLGLFILYAGTNGKALFLGLFAVLLYNGVYTPLKKRTLFAAIPGAMVGAIPPAIGWSSGGGHLEAQILAVCSFFFIWQIPHSWLLLLDFRKDYQRAGFPSLIHAWGLNQVEKISLVWVFATVVSSFLIPLFGIGNSFSILGGLPILGFWLVWKVSKTLLGRPKANPFRLAFRTVNFYMLSVMVLFSLDQLLF